MKIQLTKEQTEQLNTGGEVTLIPHKEPEFDIYSILFKDAPCMTRDLSDQVWDLRFYGEHKFFHHNKTTSHAGCAPDRTWNQVRLPTPAEAPKNMLLAATPEILEQAKGMSILAFYNNNKQEFFKEYLCQQLFQIKKFIIVEDI